MTIPGFSVLLILCCSIFFCGHVFAFVVLDLAFQYLAKRLAGNY